MTDTPERIIRNAIKCRHCDDVIESAHRHDCKHCSCGEVAVDGGKSYLRRLFPDGEPEDHFVELSETESIG